MNLIQVLVGVTLVMGLWPGTVSTESIPITIITPSAIRAAIDDVAVRNNENVNQKQQRLIEKSVHLKTDPCDNFLHYGCGKWAHFLDIDIEDNLHILDAKINRELSEYFENKDPAGHEPNFMKQVHAYYKSCKGIDIDKPPNPLRYLQWLEVSEGLHWMQFGNSYGTDHPVPSDWLHMVAILRKYGLNNLIVHEEAIQHPLNNTRMVLALKKPFAESDYHFLGPLLDENRMFTLWNISDVLDHRKFIEFDLELQDVVNYHDGTTAATPELITAEQLKELQLEWLERYLRIVLYPAPLDAQMEIYIQDVAYMKGIKSFLDEIDQHFLGQYIQLNFLSKMTNSFADPGYYECTSSTRLFFPLVMQWLHKHLHPEVAHEFYKMQLLFSNLKHVLKSTLTSEMPQFKSTVADFLTKKLDNLKLHVVDVWQPSLEQLYAGVWLQPTDYIGNRLKMHHKRFWATHSHLTTNPVVRGALEFLHRDIQDNADSMLPFLVPRQNLVVLPVTLLQFPLYHPQFNDTFIYSSLGFLLAQEIQRSFDDNNLKVDADGNLNYEIIEHLNMTAVEENTDAGRYEIVATNGLQLAYQAFSVLHPVAGDEAKLFLLNFAQLHCGNYRKFGEDINIVNNAVKSFTSIWNVFGCEF